MDLLLVKKMHVELIKDTRTVFPIFTNASEITSITIWNCKFQSLAYLVNLAHLVEIEIFVFPDNSLEFFNELKRLTYLKIIHLPLVSSLDGLRDMNSLTTLSLSTSPAWDAAGKVLDVESLDPLASLNNLAHLELFGVLPPDRSLSVLQKCQKLRTLRISQYPETSVQDFFRSTTVVNDYNPAPLFE